MKDLLQNIMDMDNKRRLFLFHVSNALPLLECLYRHLCFCYTLKFKIMTSIGNALVYGGCGALGRSIVNKFKAAKWVI